MKYNSAHTEAFYDAYGEHEWGRFERCAAGQWNDSEFWNAFLDVELEACGQPGALDNGTHIIAVLVKE